MEIGQIQEEAVFDSPETVLLSIAMRNYALLARQGWKDDLTWRVDEQKTSSFLYAFTALDARVNSAWEYRNYNRVSDAELRKWVSLNISVRVPEILKRDYSKVRARLFREVCDLRNAFAHPHAAITERTKRIEQAEEYSNGAGSYRATLLRNAPVVQRGLLRQGKRCRGHPATLLPDHPFQMTRLQLDTALLVVLLFSILVDRRYRRRGIPWPLYGVYAVDPNEPHLAKTAAAWYRELRDGYTGPAADIFQHVSIPPEMLVAH